MIAHVNLLNSGDAHVLVRWPDKVEARYFINDGAFQRWFRLQQAWNPSAAWRYVGDKEMDALLSEAGLTAGDFA